MNIAVIVVDVGSYFISNNYKLYMQINFIHIYNIYIFRYTIDIFYIIIQFILERRYKINKQKTDKQINIEMYNKTTSTNFCYL